MYKLFVILPDGSIYDQNFRNYYNMVAVAKILKSDGVKVFYLEG